MIKLERPQAQALLERDIRRAMREESCKARSLNPGSKVIASRWNTFRSARADRAGQRLFEAMRSERCYHEKCAYCESSPARTIEHVFPKAKYPKQMFSWSNLLLACRNCNEERRGQGGDAHGDVTHADPSKHEPLDYFTFNPMTGAIVPNPSEGMKERADATIEYFRLFDYDAPRLKKRRDVLYCFSRAHSETPVKDDTMERLKKELSAGATYLGIIRELLLRPHHEGERKLIREVFAKVPELRSWVGPWLRPPTWASVPWDDAIIDAKS